MEHNNISDNQRVQQNLDELNSYIPFATHISSILGNPDNAVNKLAHATRGNPSEHNEGGNVDRTHSRIINSSVQGFKNSIQKITIK